MFRGKPQFIRTFTQHTYYDITSLPTMILFLCTAHSWVTTYNGMWFYCHYLLLYYIPLHTSHHATTTNHHHATTTTLYIEDLYHRELYVLHETIQRRTMHTCIYSLVPGVSFDLFDSLYKPKTTTVHVSDTRTDMLHCNKVGLVAETPGTNL